jgi:hypothetical protein
VGLQVVARRQEQPAILLETADYDARRDADTFGLRVARTQLEGPAANQGGHHVRAIELVNRAIGEVGAGTEFAAARR